MGRARAKGGFLMHQKVRSAMRFVTPPLLDDDVLFLPSDLCVMDLGRRSGSPRASREALVSLTVGVAGWAAAKERRVKTKVVKTSFSCISGDLLGRYAQVKTVRKRKDACWEQQVEESAGLQCSLL